MQPLFDSAGSISSPKFLMSSLAFNFYLIKVLFSGLWFVFFPFALPSKRRQMIGLKILFVLFRTPGPLNMAGTQSVSVCSSPITGLYEGPGLLKSLLF